MIRLVDLLVENPENRVSITKVQVLMEKLYSELGDAHVKELMQRCIQLQEMIQGLNALRYVRTENSIIEWKVLLAATDMKLNELREEVRKISESNKYLNCAPLMKALDELLLN